LLLVALKWRGLTLISKVCKNLFFKLLFVFFYNFSPELKSVAKFKQALQVFWDNLPPTRLLKT